MSNSTFLPRMTSLRASATLRKAYNSRLVLLEPIKSAGSAVAYSCFSSRVWPPNPSSPASDQTLTFCTVDGIGRPSGP